MMNTGVFWLTYMPGFTFTAAIWPGIGSLYGSVIQIQLRGLELELGLIYRQTQLLEGPHVRFLVLLQRGLGRLEIRLGLLQLALRSVHRG